MIFNGFPDDLLPVDGLDLSGLFDEQLDQVGEEVVLCLPLLGVVSLVLENIVNDLGCQIVLSPLPQVVSVVLFEVGVQLEVPVDDLDCCARVGQSESPRGEFSPYFLVLGEREVPERPIVGLTSLRDKVLLG